MTPNLVAYRVTVIKVLTKATNCQCLFTLSDLPKPASELDCPVQHIEVCYINPVCTADSASLATLNSPFKVGQKLTLYCDRNLLKHSPTHFPVTPHHQPLAIAVTGVAIAPDSSSHCQLIYPKPLQTMPYSRIFKEAFLSAIPWLGLLICLLGAYVATKQKQQAHAAGLTFTFKPSFYWLCLIISGYPVLLLYLGLNQYLLLAMSVSYLLLILINFSASITRNREVAKYNQLITSSIESLNCSSH